MGILNGQPVDEEFTNPAFLDRRLDDTAIGKYTLSNTDPISGSSVTNLQREHNSAASFMGKSLNSVYNDLPAWTNTQVGLSTDNLKARAEALTYKFDSVGGHKHTGVQGDAPRINSSDLANVPLRGFDNQGTLLTGITGSSTNVSSVLTGKIPGGSNAALGVVTDPPYNKVVLRQGSGTDQGDAFKDANGNLVYGRLTYAATVWTLSFYVLIGGTETAYSFATSVDIDWYYQEIFNPMLACPTYSQSAFIPSDNATADVQTATQSLQGKVLLSSSTPSEISSTGNTGTANGTVALADHTHKGLHSISKQGSAQLFGDVTLTGSLTTTITQVGNNIDISSQGGVGYQETPAGPANGVNTTFGPLTYTPSSAASVGVFVDSILVPNTDWSLVGNSIVFSSNIPQLGQQVYVFYIYAGLPNTPPVPTGAFNLEYRTLSAGEITAKALTLANSPAFGNLTVVDLINCGPQVYNVDYTIAGSTLNWNGFGLDGLLQAGDILRVQYFT